MAGGSLTDTWDSRGELPVRRRSCCVGGCTERPSYRDDVTGLPICGPHFRESRRAAAPPSTPAPSPASETTMPAPGSRTKPLCTRPGCERPHIAHGLCSAHRHQAATRGLPTTRPLTAEEVAILALPPAEARAVLAGEMPMPARVEVVDSAPVEAPSLARIALALHLAPDAAESSIVEAIGAMGRLRATSEEKARIEEARADDFGRFLGDIAKALFDDSMPYRDLAENVSILVKRFERAAVDRDDALKREENAGKLIGTALVIASLAPGESLAHPIDHVLHTTVDRLRRERDEARAAATVPRDRTATIMEAVAACRLDLARVLPGTPTGEQLPSWSELLAAVDNVIRCGDTAPETLAERAAAGFERQAAEFERQAAEVAKRAAALRALARGEVANA